MNNLSLLTFPLHKRAYIDAQKVLCGELHKLRIYKKLTRKEKKDIWREFRMRIMIEDVKELNTMWFMNQGT